jgi:hypothetical protein
LEPGKSVKVDYSVMADVNANPGLYTLDVNLTFEDYQSKTKSIQTTAGLFVGGATDFDVSFSESSQGEVSLSVANVGNNIAYAVKVSVPEQNGYKVTGSSSTIVGNLEKGDYTIASFNVASSHGSRDDAGGPLGEQSDIQKISAWGNNSTSASRSSNPLKVQIEYTDAKGERITVDKAVRLEMTSGNMTEQGARGQRNSSGVSSYLVPFVIIIVIAGAGVFLYRRRKQGEKEPHLKQSD